MDEFFDEVDGTLQASGRRWYFLVDYTGCTVAPTVWEHFAERGKRTNITHGLRTVRYGPRSRRPGAFWIAELYHQQWDERHGSLSCPLPHRARHK